MLFLDSLLVRTVAVCQPTRDDDERFVAEGLIVLPIGVEQRRELFAFEWIVVARPVLDLFDRPFPDSLSVRW